MKYATRIYYTDTDKALVCLGLGLKCLLVSDGSGPYFRSFATLGLHDRIWPFRAKNREHGKYRF